MRFRSRTAAAGRVYAVTGTNTVSFAVVAGAATKTGLLGFAVRRYDLAAGTDEWMPGFKVFRTLVPNPLPGERVSTTTRSDRNTASSTLCVTNSTVLRSRSQISSSSICMPVRVCASSAPNGSSISRIFGP